MARTSLNKLWIESGKTVPFSQFATDFNKRNFRNFVSSETAEMVFGIKKNTDAETQEAIDNKMRINGIQPEAHFDKKQGVLLVVLGITAGVVAGLLIMNKK